MNLKGRNSLRKWLIGATAIGVPLALGMIGADQAASADGKMWLKPKANKSSAAVSTATVTEPPQLLSVPVAVTEVPVAVIQTVSDSQVVVAAGSSQNSEVMKQLELLYQKDGREMPDLPVMQPVPNSGTSASPTSKTQPYAAPAQPPASVPAAVPPQRTQMVPSKSQNSNSTYHGGSNTQPPTAPVITNSPTPNASASHSSKKPMTGFFKKLVPGSRESKLTAAPQGYRPDVAPVPPTVQFAPPRSQAGGASLVRPVQVSVQSGKTTAQSIATQTNAVVFSPQIPDLLSNPSIPALSNVPTPPAGLIARKSPDNSVGPPELDNSTQASLPLPLPEPQSTPAAAMLSLPVVKEISPAVPDKSGDLDNVFTEMSESEADDEDQEKKKEADPYTGVTLDEDVKIAPAPAVQSDDSSKTAAKGGTQEGEDPFAEELRKLGILPSTEEEPGPLEESPKLARPAIDSSKREGIKDVRENVRKIRERGGMPGLKGFCPVTLHDERELLDAKTELYATHRGQKFHFASAEAKKKFEQDPSRYAPAAYGADVVALTRDKDVVEGSLDFAAWFKGRLFLFGNKETHDTFVANPAEYATPSGIE